MKRTSRLRTLAARLMILLTVVSTVPSTVNAQIPARIDGQPVGPATGALRAASQTPGPLELERRETRRSVARAPGTQVQGKSRRSAVGWGILGGVVAGVAIASLGASRYAENEGGRFCTRCFVTWSAVTVPVGAGAGAVAGYLVDVARR
jgi:hypothetical protein